MSKPKQTRRPKRDLPEYVAALQENDPLCMGRSAEFVDYQTPPIAEEAAELCIECPLMLLCLRNARWRHPKWGIYGGVVWEDGRPIQDDAEK